MAGRTPLPDWAIRLGGNPYAFIDPDVEDALEGAPRALQEQLPLIDHVLALEPVAHLQPPITRRGGNPYAMISDDDGTRDAPSDSGISMADFDARCRAVLRAYMPSWIRGGPLHAHYRDFISRNRTRSAAIRQRIVEELERYALSDLPGLVTQFNRETTTITAAKLQQIERRGQTGE